MPIQQDERIKLKTNKTEVRSSSPPSSGKVLMSSHHSGEASRAFRDLFQLFVETVVFPVRELNINKTRKTGGRLTDPHGLIIGGAYKRMGL